MAIFARATVPPGTGRLAATITRERVSCQSHQQWYSGALTLAISVAVTLVGRLGHIQRAHDHRRPPRRRPGSGGSPPVLAPAGSGGEQAQFTGAGDGLGPAVGTE